MLGWALSCSGRARQGLGMGVGRGNTSPVLSMDGYLLMMGQSCVPECRGSFRVSSNNAALGSPGSSVALAINHPLTVQSSHVVTVPPPHGQQGRGASFLPNP